MGKSRAPYSPEFRAQMVALVRAGRSPEELEKEFEPTSVSIYSWVKKADMEEGRAKKSPAVFSTDEHKELQALRREVKILREEREILKKAAAWFAQETGTPSTRRSGS